MDEKQLQALFNAMGTQLGLDDYKSFKSNIYSDPKFRKAFFDEASQDLDLGDYNSFDNSFKKKVGGTVSQEPLPIPKVSPSVSILKEFPNQRAVSESTAIPGLKDQMAATEFAQKGKPIFTVLESAKSTIDNTLQNSDKILTRIIRENRLNEFDKQRKSTPTLDAFVNPAAETAKRELLVNSIVTPEEIESKKSTVISDDAAAREVLSRAAKENPNVAKSSYIIDAEARIKENEKIAPKVLNNISLIENGELVYDIKSGKLQKPEGVIKSSIRGLQERKKQIDDYDFLAGTKNDDAIISQLEADRKSFDPDEPVPVPSGAASEFSQMLGMEGIPMIKSATAAVITNAIPGAQIAAPYVSAFVTSPEYFKRSYSSGFRQAYYNLREQGKSEQEALETARKQAESEGVYGAIEGAASSFIGSKIGFKPTPIVASKSLKDVAKNVILTGKNFVTDNLPEGFADAGVAGSLQMAKNIEAINNGVDRDLFDGVADNVAGELSFTVGMGLLTKAGSTAINANTYKTVLSAISKQPKQNIDSKLGEMIVDGQITPQQADETAKRIEEFKSISSQVPDEVEDDASRAEIVSKIEEKNKLETKLKSTNPVFHQEIKDKIKDIDQQILNTYNNATQESTVTEILPEGGIIQPARIETGQPQEGQGEGGQWQGEVTPADVSNRPISSEGQVESITINKDALTSNTITEVERLKSAEIGPDDGVTLNMDGTKYEGGGLIVPIGSINTTQEELTPELIANFAEENKGKLSSNQTFKFGLYKFPDSNQVSIDLNIVTDPKNKDIALKFGKMAGQESLFDLSTFSNVPTGADGQNPIVFNDDQIKEIGKAFEEGRMPNVFGGKQTEVSVTETPIKTTLNKIIPNALKSLEKTKVKINVVNSATDTEEAKSARGNQGLFLSDDGTIIIDESKLADEVEAGIVVWHEASHPVMNIIRNTNKPLYDGVVRGLNEAAKKNTGISDALNWAQSQPEYTNEDTQNDEAIVETIGRINSGLIDINSLDTGLKQKLIDFINNIAKVFGIDPILNDTNIAAFKKTVSEVADALKTGRDIGEIVGQENVMEYGVPIGVPVQPKVADKYGSKVSHDGGSYRLSFVKPSDIIDIKSLVKDIADKGQNVWFWTADQLGRGMYYDNVIEGEHYLDAGPSFALDPKNRDKGVIWATGKGEKWVNDKIANSDYIFIISGSPQKSKLFNKRVAEITFNRIKKAVGEEGSWDKFKSEVLGVSKIGKINDILNKYNSFEELLANPERKELLIQFDAQKEKKGTPLKGLLDKYGAFIDYNDLRDGFFKDNNFNMNDVMLVLKPTGYGGKSIHSTYENDILGEVVGVPDRKVNAYDLMPDEFKAKYAPDISRTEQSQVIAPYGAGVRGVQASVGKRNLIEESKLNKKMTDDGEGNYVFFHYSPNSFKKISPRKFGSSLFTGRDERPGVGMSMFYTRPDEIESGISWRYAYIVKIPKEKVYPFNSDPLKLKSKAEAEFRKQYGKDAAFDPNKQIGFVTKVASEAGYPMTVADWRIGNKKSLRAQTTESLPVEYYQRIKSGTLNQIEENPKYVNLTEQASVGNRDIINGFYSPIEDRINSFKQPKASVNKWKDIVGVKSDEAVFSGLADWLGGMKPDRQLSKEEVSQFIKDNRIEINEVVKGKGGKMSQSQMDDVYNGVRDQLSIMDMVEDVDSVKDNPLDVWYNDPTDENYDELGEFLEQRGIDLNFIADVENDGTKFSQYQLPGGENYKEVLITLPGKDQFKSSHFDETNIVTHLRMNTRTDADGKKVLFLEEVQSDWGQKGKREGFLEDIEIKSDPKLNGFFVAYDKSGKKLPLRYNGESVSALSTEDKVREALRQTPPTGLVKSAPYVTNTNAWVKLGLKVALKEAVRQGADRIAWTTGDQQNERYDLSKSIKRVDFIRIGNDRYKYEALGLDGKRIAYDDNGTTSLQEIENMFGKDIAEKVKSDKAGDIRLQGDGLKVGGKGMKAFYGDVKNPGIVANVAKALVKELTGKEGSIIESKISSPINQVVIDRYNRARQYGNIPDTLAKEYEQATGLQGVQPAIDITPELKASVQGGMPQFSVGRRTDTDLGTGKEKTRGLAKRFEGLPTDTASKIEDEAIKYFERTNKQTKDAVLEFMDGKSNSDLADFVVSNPDIDDVSLVWMAAEVAKNLTKEIEQAKGDKAMVDELSTKQARIYNQFAKKATSLGQAVQAFVAFSDDPNATKFMLNKIIKQLKDKGLKEVTEEQVDKISELLDNVSKAKDGLPKDEAVIKLSHYLAGIAPVNGFEILQAIWYAKILSGVTTQSKNLFANLFNTSFELVAASTVESLKNKSLMPYMYAIKGLGGGFAKGAVKGLDILLTGVKKQDEGKYFRENALETFSWGRTKLGKAGKVLDFPLFIGVSPKSLKMVGRALSAADAVFSSANQEAMANMLAWAQASKEGKTNPTINNFKRANEILGNTKKVIGDAKKTALSEGYKVGTTTYKRRVIELVDQARPKKFTKSGEDFGQRVTLNFEPEGFTRPIYDMVVAAQQKAPILKMWIPFTRIVANLSEQMINYSPLGFYRAISGKRNPFGSSKDVLTNEERGELAIKAAMGLTAVGILSQVVGDDDDDWFDITANGTGDIRKNYELQKGGWRPYTITLKNGEKINYADWPIRGLLAGIGAIKDAQKYSETETDFADKLTIGALGFTTSMYESSLMKGLADFIDIFRPSRGKYDGIGDGLKKWSAQQAKSVLISNFTQQGLKMIDEYQGDPIKEAQGAEIIYRDIPVINDGLNPIIDVFGDPVKPTTSERLLPYFSVSDDKKDKLIKFLNENKIFIGVPAKRNVIDLNTEEEVPMTEKQYYDYKKLYGQKLKSYLYEYLDEYKGEDVETIKTYVQSLKDAANAEAEAELFYE